MLAPVFDLLAPSRCLSCRRRGPLPWCAACAPRPRVAAGCRRCGAAPGWVGPDGTACPLVDSDVAAVVAAFDYGGTVAAAIRGAKLEGCPAAYPPLGVAVARAVRAHDLPGVDRVTGVPVPARRRRRRGFDHAGLLARVVAAELGRPFADLLVVHGRAGDRGAGGGDVGVAAMAAPARVTGHVLLVDDVVTTGATVRVAARGLVLAGAERVTVGTVARAGGHR